MATWKTKKGKRIEIADMADSHLLNAHRMIREQMQTASDCIKILDGPLGPRGEMAQEAAEKEHEQAMSLLIKRKDILKALEEEVNNRKLVEKPLRTESFPDAEVESVEPGPGGFGRIMKLNWTDADPKY